MHKCFSFSDFLLGFFIFLCIGVKGMLDKIGAEIIGFSKMFPVEASLANFTIFLHQGQKNIESFYPQVDQMDFYRFVFKLCIYLNQIVGRKISHSI